MMQLNERFVEMLGLTPAEWKPSDGVVVAIKRGLPARCFKNFASYAHWSHARLATATAISPRTIGRRIAENARFPVDESDRLMRVARIYALAENVFGSKDAAEQWMSTPNRALDGERPIDELVTEPGTREIEDMLGRIQEGIFA